MSNAMRQVTDNVHETIYLSNLESELVATPFFYRLHDVYQSSTVYMTYPSNRTKRYEHCLGTMKIASDMLFAAISNAEPGVRENLYRHLYESLKELLRRAIYDAGSPDVGYYSECSSQFNNALDVETRKALRQALRSGGSSDELIQHIGCAIDRGIRDGCLTDRALDHYQIAPSQGGADRLGVSDASMRVFLHKCVVEAVRLVALFHDVGHPPYSHVIEAVLGRLYDEIHLTGAAEADECRRQLRSKLNPSKLQRFEECLSRYRLDGDRQSSPYPMLLKGEFNVPDQLHECVSLAFFHAALKNVVKSEIDRIARSSEEPGCKVTAMLFDICVFEFAIAILEEKNMLFASLHSIIDGTIDADRLDYVARDPKNSGMAKSGIAYRRLLDSLKLIDAERARSIKTLDNGEEIPDGFFALAFPSKITADLSDLLVERYKVFAHINWHHRVMRTASTLQDAVYSLALDYLSSTPDDDGNDPCVNPEIHMLWGALGSQIGSSEMCIIQWNDSWLINVLHASLVALSDDVQGDSTCCSSKVAGEEALDSRLVSHVELLRDLEEILLNRRKFYGFIRRDEDVREFVRRIFEKAGITREGLKRQLKHEIEKLLSDGASDAASPQEAVSRPRGEDAVSYFVDNPASDARHSIIHIRNLLKAMDTLDLQLLDALSLSGSMKLRELIEQELAKLKEGAGSDYPAIADYSVRTNNARDKIGVPKDDGFQSSIYLYDESGYFLFDTKVSLIPQLEAMRIAVPWLQIYIAPREGEVFDESFSDFVMEKLTTAIGDSLKQRYDSLYRSGR